MNSNVLLLKHVVMKVHGPFNYFNLLTIVLPIIFRTLTFQPGNFSPELPHGKSDDGTGEFVPTPGFGHPTPEIDEVVPSIEVVPAVPPPASVGLEHDFRTTGT